VPLQIEPPRSVLLLVGREEFTPPGSFGGETCAASGDCIAIGVGSDDHSAVTVTLGPAPASADLLRLASFEIDTEGLVSLRSVYNREYEAIGVPAGTADVVIWGNRPTDPDELVIEVAAKPG
jgi:hypothetical protein